MIVQLCTYHDVSPDVSGGGSCLNPINGWSPRSRLLISVSLVRYIPREVNLLESHASSIHSHRRADSFAGRPVVAKLFEALRATNPPHLVRSATSNKSQPKSLSRPCQSFLRV